MPKSGNIYCPYACYVQPVCMYFACSTAISWNLVSGFFFLLGFAFHFYVGANDRNCLSSPECLLVRWFGEHFSVEFQDQIARESQFLFFFLFWGGGIIFGIMIHRSFGILLLHAYVMAITLPTEWQQSGTAVVCWRWLGCLINQELVSWKKSFWCRNIFFPWRSNDFHLSRNVILHGWKLLKTSWKSWWLRDMLRYYFFSLFLFLALL